MPILSTKIICVLVKIVLVIVRFNVSLNTLQFTFKKMTVIDVNPCDVVLAADD